MIIYLLLGIWACVYSVSAFLAANLVLAETETEFLEKFKRGQYMPELLFTDNEIIIRIQDHPMAIWRATHAMSEQDWFKQVDKVI